MELSYNGRLFERMLAWYSISNNINSNNYTKEINIPWEILPNNICDMYAKAIDYAGNVINSKKLFTIYKDQLPPDYEINMGAKFNMQGWYNNPPDWLSSSIDVDFIGQGESKIKDVYYGISNNNHVEWYIVTKDWNRNIYENLWGINWVSINSIKRDICII